MPVVISQKPQFKWGLHKSKYVHVVFGTLSYIPKTFSAKLLGFSL